MTTADDLFDEIFDEAGAGIERLGLRALPFTESPSGTNDTDRLRKVFTGRLNELKAVFTQLRGGDRRRILVFGRIGSGKSAFVLQVLATLQRKIPDILTVYSSLDPDSDLVTTAFIALAQALPKDDWAQTQLHQLGLATAKPQKERTTEASGSLKFFGAKLSEKSLAPGELERPAEALQQLIDRARKTYTSGVIIAIDDLDKQDPARVRRLMHDAQGTLKGQASFILTGHPIGMMGDLFTSERGLFDLQIELKDLDMPTTQKMLAKYLTSVRIKPDPSDDPKDPTDIRPFTPDAAKQFCRASRGKPRLFNRLGASVLNTAILKNATQIDLELLKEGLTASQMSRRELARLTDKENRLRTLLSERGTLSDEDILMEDLETLGFRSFNELLPLLEKLEYADLASRNELGYATEFEPLNVDLPFSEFPD
ncbi:MAG: AAA family ATPase [Cyanophyceae cyanobacterium]